MHSLLCITLHNYRDSVCLGTFAHGFVRLPRLEASRLREAAPWQLVLFWTVHDISRKFFKLKGISISRNNWWWVMWLYEFETLVHFLTFFCLDVMAERGNFWGPFIILIVVRWEQPHPNGVMLNLSLYFELFAWKNFLFFIFLHHGILFDRRLLWNSNERVSESGIFKTAEPEETR